MNKKQIRRLLCILASTAFFFTCGSGKKTEEGTGRPIAGVTLETVRLAPTPDIYEAVGTIRSETSSVLGTQISGAVREIRVKPGDRVRRGELLAVLDDRSPRAQLGAAQAGVEEASQGLAEIQQALQAAAADRQFAEANYRRYQGLLEKNSVSRQEFEGAEARYKAALANERALEAKKRQSEARAQQARAHQENAQTYCSYSRLVSPLDGVVTAKSVDEGTFVMPGTPILTVEDTSRYRLEASLAEQLLPKVKVGQPVTVTTEHAKLEGYVVEIVPTADVSSRTFLVKIGLPARCDCRSGEYGKAAFPVGEEKRLVVSRHAVLERGQLEGVFVVNEKGVAEYRLVKTGKDFGDRVEILSGLAEGERIATSQFDRLRDGARVEAP